MVKRIILHLIVQLVGIVTAGLLAFIPAIIMTGGIGGIAIGLAPEITFGLVDDIVCPEGTLEYYSIQRSYHGPGEFEPHLECVSDKGEHDDVLFPAFLWFFGVIFTVLFVIIFLVLYIPLGLVAFWGTRKIIDWQESRRSNNHERRSE